MEWQHVYIVLTFDGVVTHIDEIKYSWELISKKTIRIACSSA